MRIARQEIKVHVYLKWRSEAPLLEVVHSNCQGVHDLSIGLIFRSMRSHLLADGLQAASRAQCLSQLHVPMSLISYLQREDPLALHL